MRKPIQIATSIALCLLLGGGVVLADKKGKRAKGKKDDVTLEFTADGKLIRPGGWREWVYVGTPLTPNSLNGGTAGFPEFHNVYIDPVSYAHWKETGKFRDGTIIAKELALVGSEQAVSGKGYFMGELQGFEIAYKSKKRFPDEPNNWAYFTFGHKPEPYDNIAAAQPTGACAACHQASAKDDMVFTQYYPILRASKKNASGSGTRGR